MSKILISIIFFVSLLLTAHAWSDSVSLPLVQGAEAGLHADYTSAFQVFAAQAQQGNPVAEERLASLFFFGQGTAQDYQQAFTWYQRAANQGIIAAQYMVGYAYLRGLGTPANYQRAKQYLENVATLPKIVPASPNSDKSNPEKMLTRLTEQNEQFGTVYWKLLAQRDLGEVYARGLGVNADPQKAYAWYALVAIHGDPAARSAALGIATQFSTQQLTKAHAMFAAWEDQFGV